MIEVSPDLQAFLREEYDRCLDQTLEEERENALDRYNGEPYGDEEEGNSQVVARDTAETVDYMTISVLRTIISGERVVEFTHRNVEAAHEATETIMHLLMDEQDGYRILHDWLKAGLLEKNAVAMTFVEKQPKKRVTGQIPADLLSDEHTEADPAGIDPETGLEIFDVVSMEDQPDKFLDAAVPNEEFYCSPDARSIDEAAIKGRRVRKTLSDLVEMGFPREEVENIASGGHYSNQVATARDEDRYSGDASRRGMSRVIWWHEEYVRFDANEDGIAETLYVQRSDDYKIFSIEEVDDADDHPFIDWCPFPMPHRRVGQSLADKVMDLERIRTVLLRQSLDGIYLANNPSTYLHEDSIGENTVEDLLTVRAGRLVRWKGNTAPVERSGSFDASNGFQMLEFMNRERETRTGITRLNMGLDEDTLNQTAKGQAQLIARGEQVEEYVARNFANAVARLITKKARQLQRYGKPIIVPIDGEYREVDPSAWPEDMIARARVGLGVTRIDQRIAFRREVMGMQAQALQAGLPIVDDQKFYNSAKGFIADAGLGSVSEYFNKPPVDENGQPVAKETPPDPAMEKVKADAMLSQQKLQQDQQAVMARIEGEKQLSAVKLQLQQQADAASLQAMREKAAAEQQLARDKAEFEATLARDKATFEATLAREKMDYSMRDVMSQNRPGGDLDK